jgi:hypothetical protein
MRLALGSADVAIVSDNNYCIVTPESSRNMELATALASDNPDDRHGQRQHESTHITYSVITVLTSYIEYGLASAGGASSWSVEFFAGKQGCAQPH